jgi:hypothetical protein
MTTPLNNSVTMYEDTHSEYSQLNAKFAHIVANIRKFNGSRLAYITTKAANGKTFKAYQDGLLVQEIALLSDRYGCEITRTSYIEAL